MSENRGIIGEIEKFLSERYPIPKLYARQVATAVNSLGLKDLRYFKDQWGPVKANIYAIYIGTSGFAFKTPIIRRIRDEIIEEEFPNLLAPSTFTSQGFVEHVTGRKKTEENEGEPPRKEGIIIKEEASRMHKEKTKSAMDDNYELLCEIWDGHISSYRTRTYGLEGGMDVYFSLLCVSSEYFLKFLEEDFFTVGLGHRVLWAVEEVPREPKRLDPNQFFFDSGETDKEWESKKEKTVAHLKKLFSANILSAYVFPEAGELWADYQYECFKRAMDAKLAGSTTETSYLTKLPLQALKLAMNYSASREDIYQGMLNVRGVDMKNAIEDCNLYEDNFRRLFSWWMMIQRDTRFEERLRVSKYDLRDMIQYAYDHGGLCSAKEISSYFSLPAMNQIYNVLALGVRKGYLEIAGGPDNIAYEENRDKGVLSDDEFQRFKPKTGSYPQVYRITKEGRKYLGIKSE